MWGTALKVFFCLQGPGTVMGKVALKIFGHVIRVRLNE
jgi:hypothetical protein